MCITRRQVVAMNETHNVSVTTTLKLCINATYSVALWITQDPARQRRGSYVDEE